MGATNVDVKFTDQHVRANPELWRRAVQYLDEYTGDFEFLVKARRVLAQGGKLRTPVVRGILNCMRYDVDVQDLPEPDELPTCSDKAVDPDEFVGYVRPRHLQVVPDPRPTVALRAEFKKSYLLNTRPKYESNNPRAHVLKHNRSSLTVENGVIVWRLTAWCGWGVSNRDHWRTEFGKLSDDPGDLPICGSCLRLLHKAGEK